MDNNSLTHWGIKGMKWGVRRYQNKDGGLTPAGRKRYSQKTDSPPERGTIKKNPKRMTETELKDRIARLELEKKVKDLEKGEPSRGKNIVPKSDTPERGTVRKNVKKMSETELKDRIARLELEKRVRDLEKSTTARGRNFVFDVLETSGKNIATQATTAVMGIGVNMVVEKLFGEEFKDFVNPKKGQKDK